MANHTNAELVAVHWLRSLGLAPGIATSLPERSASFASHGFVRVAVVGGAPDLDTGRQASVIRLDAFAYAEGSRTPPFGKAATILANVKAHVDGLQVHGRVTTPATFLDARIMGAATVSDPQRVPDEGGMAHYTMSVQLWWVPIPS
jgi:hypothetical protein